MKKLLIAGVLSLFVLMVGFTPAFAQTNISGDISGTITDTTGAVVPNAVVTVTNVLRGQVKSATTNANGQYRVNLLSPGDYVVQVSAQNFEKTSEKVTVSPAIVRTVDLKLTVGNQATTIEVSAEAGLLHTDDAQLSTSFSYEQVQSLPNPGNDLTFVAQTAPGSVMNTQGGYGNFSSFGLPATSNTFTVNGGYENDPFLNLSNSGATNLLLGNNDISTVTVVAPAYSASFGGLAGAQVAEISRSGANTVHGNLQYFWNGSSMNANDWFNNNSGTPKSFSNSNQWAASIGGPIKKDKMFFFINTEGLRVIIPVRATIYSPNAAYQAAILSPNPSKGTLDTPDTDPTNLTPYGNLAANNTLSQAPLYQTIFGYFNNAPGASGAIPSSAATGGDPTRFNQFNAQGSNFAQEWIITGRFDWNPSNNDKFFVHYKQDKGVQPTQTNLLSPLFNANSPQPQYEGQAGWTRSIGANITNQFVLAGSYYRAIFANANQAEATASVPFVFIPQEADWGNNAIGTSTVGGANYAFPQGRLVTQYQFIDDLTISKGRHTISLGFAFRRDDVSDFTPSEHVVPEVVTLDSNNFAAGYVDEFVQRFPQRLEQPLAVYTLGGYIQDQWKVTPQFTLTAGLRLEHNSNPICLTNCFSNLSGTFSGLSPLTTTPYNQLFASGRHQAFLEQQVIAVNPRIGFAFVPGASGKTTIRGGFGMFTDSFPAQIASDLDTNPPGVARFTVLGAAFGTPYTVDPNRTDSAAVAASASAQAFAAAYPNGGSYSSILAATNGIFRRPAFTGTAPKVYTPTTEEWSLAVERQLDSKTVVSASYVGNHSYHGPVFNPGVNAYGTVDGLPSAIPNGSLGSTAVYESTNQSNYNGLVLSATRRSTLLTLQFNYAYSHSLDLVSNGGFNAFGVNPEGQENPYNLSQNYGNSDYNVKHYISASYIINIPAPKGPKVLVGGWELAGTVFHSSGLPFTVTDSATAPSNYGGTLFADQLSNNFSHSCGGEAHAGAAAVPCSFGALEADGETPINFGSATRFGSQGRNSLTGPAYTDTDLTITKTFAIPFREAKLKMGAQFFNILNHPNFAQPNFDLGAGGIGVITSTVSTPTSILGSFLGGDASPRLIQLVGKFTF